MANFIKTKVFVGQLPNGCSPFQLKDIFSKCGDVVDVSIVKEKFAFVHMSTPEAAENAIRCLNGYELMGSYLVVQASKSLVPAAASVAWGDRNAGQRRPQMNRNLNEVGPDYGYWSSSQHQPSSAPLPSSISTYRNFQRTPLVPPAVATNALQSRTIETISLQSRGENRRSPNQWQSNSIIDKPRENEYSFLLNPQPSYQASAQSYMNRLRGPTLITPSAVTNTVSSRLMPRTIETAHSQNQPWYYMTPNNMTGSHEFMSSGYLRK